MICYECNLCMGDVSAVEFSFTVKTASTHCIVELLILGARRFVRFVAFPNLQLEPFRHVSTERLPSFRLDCEGSAGVGVPRYDSYRALQSRQTSALDEGLRRVIDTARRGLSSTLPEK